MSIADARRVAASARKEIAALEEELMRKTEDITFRWEEVVERVERVPVTPRRSDVQIDFFGLAWIPHWQITLRDRLGAVTSEEVPAF